MGLTLIGRISRSKKSPQPLASIAPIGSRRFFQTFSTFVGKPGLYLEDLYVRPHMRGRGFGKLLLRRVAELAVERDCGRLEWSVLDWNDPAIRFYEGRGARAMGDWTVYRLTEDNLSVFHEHAKGES